MAPPQIRANIQLNHLYRFTSTNATATAITGTSILCAAGSVGTLLNTQVNSFVGSFKIRSIGMWTPPPSQGSAATCSVDWSGFNNSPNVEISDTSNSVARPAHLMTSPPTASLASFWQLSGSTNLAILTAPVGTIIDVRLDLVLYDSDITQATSTVTTAALGTVYYLSLDPNATHHYVPVSLTTTT